MLALQILCPIPLTVIWHENRTSYLSIRKSRTHLHLRLHRLFQEAPSPVLEALIQYALKRDPAARIVVRKMAHLYFSQNRTDPTPLSPFGKTYNLQEIYERLQLLLPVPDLSIGWSPRRASSRFRSITFGTYDNHRHQIRLNPLLDDPQVPLYFVEFIVYHEMLHAVCRMRMRANGRCHIHTPEFRERERQFPQFQAAKEWEKTSLTFFKKRKSHGRT